SLLGALMWRILSTLFLAWLSLSSAWAAAPENWADPKLPVRDGLELWLDAAHATGEQIVPADGKLAEWKDASGRGRHLRQSQVNAQPTRFPAGGGAIVRFDGVEQHLRAVKQAVELKSFTVFVVVAPKQNLGPFRGFLAFNAAGQRDYVSGLNIDMGAAAPTRSSAINVEGRGVGGARNLRTGGPPVGTLPPPESTSEAAAETRSAHG